MHVASRRCLVGCTHLKTTVHQLTAYLSMRWRNKNKERERERKKSAHIWPNVKRIEVSSAIKLKIITDSMQQWHTHLCDVDHSMNSQIADSNGRQGGCCSCSLLYPIFWCIADTFWLTFSISNLFLVAFDQQNTSILIHVLFFSFLFSVWFEFLVQLCGPSCGDRIHISTDGVIDIACFRFGAIFHNQPNSSCDYHVENNPNFDALLHFPTQNNTNENGMCAHSAAESQNDQFKTVFLFSSSYPSHLHGFVCLCAFLHSLTLFFALFDEPI